MRYFVTISGGDLKAAQAELDPDRLAEGEPADEPVSIVLVLDAEDSDDAEQQVREALPENGYTGEVRDEP